MGKHLKTKNYNVKNYIDKNMKMVKILLQKIKKYLEENKQSNVNYIVADSENQVVNNF